MIEIICIFFICGFSAFLVLIVINVLEIKEIDKKLKMLEEKKAFAKYIRKLENEEKNNEKQNTRNS